MEFHNRDPTKDAGTTSVTQTIEGAEKGGWRESTEKHWSGLSGLNTFFNYREGSYNERTKIECRFSTCFVGVSDVSWLFWRRRDEIVYPDRNRDRG